MYDLVVCGGTFDHFHKGHENFLAHAISLSKKMLIGVTSDEFLKSSKFKVQSSKFFESYEIRKRSVENFLKENSSTDRAKIIKIEDVFGPTLDKNFNIDAIVVTKDSIGGADLINRERQKAGLLKLKVIVAPLKLGQNNKPISSGQIRKGIISRQGNLYLNQLWLKKNLILPQSLREEFKKPFGELILDVSKNLKDLHNRLVVTVGDITTKNFNKANASQKISVVDFKVARKKEFDELSQLGFSGHEKVLKVNNPPSHITSDLFSKIESLFNTKTEERIILQIEGEEDLAVLPLVLLAPLYTIIYYGQPGKGVIKVRVTEEQKEKAYMLINKFKSS